MKFTQTLLVLFQGASFIQALPWQGGPPATAGLKSPVEDSSLDGKLLLAGWGQASYDNKKREVNKMLTRIKGRGTDEANLIGWLITVLDYQSETNEVKASKKEKRGTDEANLIGWLITVLDYQSAEAEVKVSNE